MSEDNDSQIQRRAEDRIGQKGEVKDDGF